mgnify:CR=1 FL=1
MFRKIELWVLYLTLLLGFLFTILFGALIHHGLTGGSTFKLLSKPAIFLATIPLNIYNIITLNQDLILEDRFPKKTGFVGEPNDTEIYLLLSHYDGALNENVVDLIDLRSFETLHRWNPDLNEIYKKVNEENPEFAGLLRDKNDTRGFIGHPLLSKDGSLVFQDTAPLNKIGYCSEPIWQNEEDYFHHSIERDHENNIWVSSRLFPYNIDSKYVGNQNGTYFDDAFTKLSPKGDILYTKSVTELFIENDMKYLLFSIYAPQYYGDTLHMNDIQPVKQDGPYWKKGDIFFSLRHQSMVGLYRPSTNELLWKGVGKFYNQHDVDILNDHQIAIFNNNSVNTVSGNIVDGTNEILIYDFQTGKYSSYLKDALTKHDVRTVTGGRSEILNNGDLYIEETDYGRTLYFNNDGSLRWEHINRAPNGNIYPVGWSRILYKPEDLAIVRDLQNKKDCP